MLVELATFAPAILVKRAVMSADSPGGWNGVYPAVNSNVRTPSAQQSADLQSDFVLFLGGVEDGRRFSSCRKREKQTLRR